jgi:tetratricopeptide (TPR) repeat protein
MKKLLSPLLLTLVVMILAATAAEAQIRTPRPSPMIEIEQEAGLGTITLNYSRPGMKDRTVFGDLVPYGKIWRTGANQSSKITFSEDVKVAGNAVKAGTYAIYTIPNKDSWTIMLYSDLSLGGNVAGYDEDNEVVRFTVEPQELPFKVETFTMLFNNLRDDHADLVLYWENTLVSARIEFEVEDAVMASIERTMAGPSGNDYRAAALYYYNNDKDLDQALEWINKSLEGGERYWIVTNKAQILAKMGKKDEAMKAAKRATQLAKDAKNMDYVKINADIMESLQ